MTNYRNMFESWISAGAIGKLPCPKKPEANISSWSNDMEGHAKQCVERYCEMANRTTQEIYKVATPCIDDHQLKKEEMRSVGELSNVCSQIDLKCLYLARIGRPDILWSVNKLARAVTKWTRTCDKRVARLISYTHHTSEFKQQCHVGNAAQQCSLGLFQESDFAGYLEESKIDLSRTFVHIWKSYTRSSKLDVQIMLENSLKGIGRLSGLDQKGTHVHKPDGEWDELAEIMMLNFSERGHPVFSRT